MSNNSEYPVAGNGLTLADFRRVFGDNENARSMHRACLNARLGNAVAGEVQRFVADGVPLRAAKPQAASDDSGPVRALPQGDAREPPELWRPFPTAALPQALREFVEHGAQALGCDAAYIALPALAVCAGAVGNTRRILLKQGRRGWAEPAILWTVIVGESGTLKSPAFDLPLQHNYDLQAEQLTAYQKEMAAHQAKKLEHEAELATWKRKKGEKGDPPTLPDPPACKRLVCADVTLEKLAVILQENPRGLLVARDEIAAWISSFTRYRQKGVTDAPAWLELHRAGTLIVDRKTGEPRTVFVRRAAVSIAGGIQPGTLRRTLTRDFFEMGLAARLLLAMPPRVPKQWSDVTLSDGVIAAFEAVIGKLWELQAGADARGDVLPIDLPPTKEAKAVWIQFYDQHAAEQTNLTGDLAAAWAKLEAYAARFALLTHLIRQASGDVTLQGPGAIDPSSMESGVTLARWFAAEAKRIYGLFGASPERWEDERLAEFIAGRGGTVTVRDLQRANGRRFRTAGDAEAALKRLTAAELGELHGREFRLHRVRQSDSPTESPTTRFGECPTQGVNGEEIPRFLAERPQCVGHVGLSDKQSANGAPDADCRTPTPSVGHYPTVADETARLEVLPDGRRQSALAADAIGDALARGELVTEDPVKVPDPISRPKKRKLRRETGPVLPM